MAAGVGGAKKFFWTLVNNWKQNKNAELTLNSENGHLLVKYSGDLGVWVPPAPPPPSDPASSGHQGPRKGAGPCRQRRRERRAAKRAAATVTEYATSAKVVSKSVEDTTEKVDDTIKKGNNVGTEKVPAVEIPSSEDSFEKPAVVEKPVKKPVTHDRFKCEQCEKRLDTKNCLTNHMISEHKQPGEVFKCDACEFETSRKMGLTIHMSKKHDVIEQLDGNNSSSEDRYSESYWERDYMGTWYQTYQDAIENIESANISREEKSSETERALKAREDALLETGDTLEFIHKSWPPWSSGAGYW